MRQNSYVGFILLFCLLPLFFEDKRLPIELDLLRLKLLLERPRNLALYYLVFLGLLIEANKQHLPELFK